MPRSLAAGIAASLALALGFAPAAGAQDGVPVPRLERRVTDLTGTLTEGERTALEEKLAAFERREGSQIAVLLVPTTGAETIEEFGIRVAEAWRLGREGIDDGVLFLVARDDRALRLEVGYGLEGALPDATANRIVEDIVVPRFRAGDFHGGVNAGVDAMIQVIDGEPLPEPEDPPVTWPGDGGREGWPASLLTIGFLLVVVVGSVLRALVGRLPAAVIIGGLTGAIAWALVASLLAAVVVAVIAFLFTLIGGMPGQRRGGYRGGGWGAGWPSPGGGGWSGGGGGFGGGGASGRW